MSVPVKKEAIVDIVRASIAPGATDDQLRYFLAVAERTGLDPLTGQIKMLVVRKKAPNGMYVDAVQPYIGVDGARVIAERSGKYAGQEGPFWCGPDGVWREVWLESTPPAAAKVGVRRTDFVSPIWGVATWAQYAQVDKTGSLARAWATHGPLMLAKCAEMIALRRAFPMDLSGLYSEEEIASVPEFQQAVQQVAEPPMRQKSLAAVAWAKLRPLIRQKALSDDDVREWVKANLGKESSSELTEEDWDAVGQWIASLPDPVEPEP